MNNNKGFFIVLAIIFLLVGALVYKSVTDRTITNTTIKEELKQGKPDTVFVAGKPDTVFLSRIYEKVIRVPVENITNYARDSSKTDTTVVLQNGTINIGITTYPAIESLKLDIDLLTIDREIYRIDTLKMLRVDTLNITKEIKTEPSWYETWWFGSIITGATALTIAILSK
jgi:hypothetical protein